MGRKIVCSLVSLSAVLALLAVSAYSQDEAGVSTAQTVQEEVDRAMKSEELSVYGEIQSSDTRGAGSLTVQYYDYDTDEEKTIVITLDTGTKIENVQSIADIKKGDWADITYSADGAGNIAKSVIVEREEDITPADSAE